MLTLPSFAGPTSARSVTRTVRMRFSVGTTNGLEFFFFRREKQRFDVKFEPIGDWPMGDESIGTRDVVSNARMRRADPDMLRTAFRLRHNFIHGNEGMPKDAAFWQFLYLIVAKMHDERQPVG